MKTNRRSKRVKKTRRNRRSRRTQRGGGEGDPMYEFMIKRCKEDCLLREKIRENNINNPPEEEKEVCIKNCETDFIPLQHYDVKTATKNGWYIYSKYNSHGKAEYYLAHKKMPDHNLVIQSPSYFITYTNESDKKANEFDKKLDELPDLDKTYETGSLFNRLFKKKLINTWKLRYNVETLLFEWQNQTDKKMTRQFLIESPLKIGDKIATESK